jgi:cyclic pyranopterin monophosphate synthase
MNKLSHLDSQGAAHMVDISAKPSTTRQAGAEGHITMSTDALRAIQSGAMKKGDVLAVARIAGIMAAKKTSDLIPLCHPLALSKVSIDFDFDDTGIRARATAICNGKTGIEMEALTAVSIALLTLYDMSKSMDKTMIISGIRLLTKTGGKSGDWHAPI